MRAEGREARLSALRPLSAVQASFCTGHRRARSFSSEPVSRGTLAFMSPSRPRGMKLHFFLERDVNSS